MNYNSRKVKRPGYGMMIAVLDHILTGLDIDDERIEKISMKRR